MGHTMREFRTDVADVLKANLTGWDIQPFTTEKTIGKPTAMVGASTIERGTTHVVRRRQVVITIITPKTTPGQADDALDDLLEAVLDVVDTIDSVTWSQGQRAVYAESNPAYTINLTLED